jgi:4-carboxymuconolactone decarboxylase
MSEPNRRFGPMPLDSMTPEQRQIADAIMSGPRQTSFLRGPFEVWLHSPGLADTAQRLGAQVRFGSSLPNALNELAIILVARRYSAQFEWYVHRQLAVEAGLDPAVPDAIAIGETPELDADGLAVYGFVTELLDGGDVSDQAFDRVVSRWGKRGAVDLMGLVGYYTLVSFALNVDRYPVPGPDPPLPPL